MLGGGISDTCIIYFGHLAFAFTEVLDKLELVPGEKVISQLSLKIYFLTNKFPYKYTNTQFNAYINIHLPYTCVYIT